MYRVLKAKHWHFFIIGFILPILISTFGIILSFNSINGTLLFFTIPVSVVISQLVLYLWLWSAGNVLYKIAGINRSFENRVFRFFVVIPVVLVVLMLGFWLWGASILGMGKFSMANVLIAALIYIVPVQFIFIVSKFYCFYFAAKVIKSAELQRVANFDDFVTDFVLIMLFPVGIWFLQPRVNLLIKKYSNAS
ncbi:hypothetical protein QA597_00715 [Marinilabiliaceae bacterium ANBcel2]|nr:hypothetical protein [Marinilabiliaceae bacterium ANBcel2]